MFTRILVPLDESPYSERALTYAEGILAPSQGKLTLLTVVHPPPTGTDPISRVQAERPQRAKQYLEEQAAALRGRGVDVHAEVTEGDTSERILERAAQENVEVIVMSTHGLGASGRYAVGSVALKVLMTAPCPVFMIRIQEAWKITPEGEVISKAESDVGHAVTAEERWLLERLADVDSEIARLDGRAPVLSDQVANALHPAHEQAKWSTLWDLRQRALLLEERDSILRARWALTE